MTTATMVLAELAEKGAGVDVLHQRGQFMVQRLMEIDAHSQQSAPPHAGCHRAGTRRILARRSLALRYICRHSGLAAWRTGQAHLHAIFCICIP